MTIYMDTQWAKKGMRDEQMIDEANVAEKEFCCECYRNGHFFVGAMKRHDF